MDRSNPDAADRSISGADFLGLRIERAPAGAMSGWLVEQIRAAVRDGRLRPDDRLPATRTLALDLGVSRGVVTEAYRRLVDDGVVVTGGRAGTDRPDRPDRRSTRAGRGRRPAGTGGDFAFDGHPGHRRLRRAARRPARFDLSPGLPDLAAFPRAAWLRAERAVLTPAVRARPRIRGPARRAGVPPGRRRLAGPHTAASGPTRSRSSSSRGSPRRSALLAQVLGRRGLTEIAVEDPGSLGRAGNSWSTGAWRTPPVPVDDAGPARRRAAAGRRTGGAGDPGAPVPDRRRARRRRRRELCGLGRRRRADHRGRLRRRAPLRPAAGPRPALDARRHRICYAGSVSKLLAPALRIGWLIAPALVTGRGRRRQAGRGPRQRRSWRSWCWRSSWSPATGTPPAGAARRHRRRRDAMIAAIAHAPAGRDRARRRRRPAPDVTFDEPRDRRSRHRPWPRRPWPPGEGATAVLAPGRARAAGAGARLCGRIDRAHRGGDHRARLGRRQPGALSRTTRRGTWAAPASLPAAAVRSDVDRRPIG